MRLTLIHPCIGRRIDQPYIRLWQMEPLPPAVIAGLTPRDVEVKFYDDRMERIPFDEPTDVVGISVETYTAKRSYQIASEYRKRGVPVVMGGFQASLCPEEVSQYADAVIVGEAEEVWEQVRTRYYDPALHGLDWRALGETFRPLATEARDQTEFYSVLRRMLGHLRDPHTRVFAPGESPDLRVQRFVTVGLSVREIEGEAVVTLVEPGSEAERAGVRAGDSVLSLDGEPVSTLVARRSEQTSAPAATARLLAVARLFDGPRDTQVSAVLSRRGRAAREKSACACAASCRRACTRFRCDVRGAASTSCVSTFSLGRSRGSSRARSRTS